MSSQAIALVMFGCVLASTLIAMWIARRLPEQHLNSDSREVVKLGLGVIGTLTALVLGLLVASTKGTYDAQSATVKEIAAQVAVADRILDRFGPGAEDARAKLRLLADTLLNQVWPQEKTEKVEVVGGPTRLAGEAFYESVMQLDPKTDSQRLLKSRAQDVVVGMAPLRQRLVVNSERSIPVALLAVLGIWQSALFAGFGLLAPRNGTAITVLILCMVSVSVALFLVLELDRPFEGIVRVSDTPLRAVISQLGR
jgi:hypothetical protein